MRLILIIIIFDRFLTITHFSMPKPQRTIHPLCQMGQFVQKDFYINLLTHIGLKFNQEVSWSIRKTNNITITQHTLTFQSTMNNIHINLMTWIILVQKPGGNILTEPFRITVSRMRDERHVPQCINQIKEPTKMSFSLAVIHNPPCIHQVYNHHQ